MNLLENQINAIFKTDAEGKTVFFPWGPFGKGYVVPDDTKEQQIRRFLGIYSPLSSVFSGIVIWISLLINTPWLNVVIIPFIILPYIVGIMLLLKGLVISDMDMTYNAYIAKLGTIFTVLFLIGAIGNLYNYGFSWERLGVVSLFAVAAFGSSYLLVRSKKAA